jgi:DNA-binding MarR family transcriptional regulator
MMPPMSETAEHDVAPDRARRLTPRDPRLGSWRAFLMAHALVSRRLDDDLRSEQELTLAEYAALLQLAEAPGRRLRMNQLAEGIFLSRSGVTRLIDRLEADGLVTRSLCSSDGRGAEAVMTDVGHARLRQASRTHLRGIEAYFLASVEPVDLKALERSCSAIGDRVRAEGRPAVCDPSVPDPERAPD